MTITLDDALAKLPAEVQEALRRGEEVVLTRDDAPVARIVPFVKDKPRRRANRMGHEEMDRLAREAMADPDFAGDMRDTQAAFSKVDALNWPAFNGDEREEAADNA